MPAAAMAAPAVEAALAGLRRACSNKHKHKSKHGSFFKVRRAKLRWLENSPGAALVRTWRRRRRLNCAWKGVRPRLRVETCEGNCAHLYRQLWLLFLPEKFRPRSAPIPLSSFFFFRGKYGAGGSFFVLLFITTKYTGWELWPRFTSSRPDAVNQPVPVS